MRQPTFFPEQRFSRAHNSFASSETGHGRYLALRRERAASSQQQNGMAGAAEPVQGRWYQERASGLALHQASRAADGSGRCQPRIHSQRVIAADLRWAAMTQWLTAGLLVQLVVQIASADFFAPPFAAGLCFLLPLPLPLSPCCT
jgi:hypothetical protein